VERVADHRRVKAAYRDDKTTWRCHVTTREKVLKLHKQGLKGTEIAERVGVTKQRVHQILQDPTDVGRSGRPRVTAQGEREAKRILASRNDWTWVEAETEIEKHKVKVRALSIFTLLKDLGFVYAPEKRRWFR